MNCVVEPAVEPLLISANDEHGQGGEALHGANFLAWLDAQGVTYPAMRIADVNGVRGVVAARAIKAGELVLHIPQGALLTLAVARSSNVAQAMAESGKPFADETYLAACLIEQAREGGSWMPYVALLPNDPIDAGYGRVPELLRGTSIDPRASVGKPGNAAAAMAAQYGLLKSVLAPLSLQEFVRMWHAVATRAFRVEIDGRQTIAMAPLADMLNHAAAPNVAWSRNVTDGYRFVALQDIAAGAELKDTYGPYGNAELFWHYGFCLDDNPFDRVAIGLPDIHAAHPFSAHVESLGTRQDGMRIFHPTDNPEAAPARAMFTYLRVACLADVDTLRHALSQVEPGHPLPLVSMQNEMAVRTALRRACLRALRRYERTVEEDNRLLTQPRLTWPERCAILVGRGEKRILQRYVDFC